ncbi:hypothetical protein C1H76_4984 [Elsinoe australis]|uniref:Uncharacterized protein n=1 Tax=Elsinoe australis TaxID=40998 RepID=A0A4U7AWL8_9PEZI|nr:hypothetical protein C1H76_4984 [Elsinoe australis]
MVAFYSIIMAGLLSTMAFASPAPAANEPVEFETEFKAIEARQVPEKRCLAIVINYRPNSATGFFPGNPGFPNCNILTEINFPNCDQYRVVSVTNCGGERLIDIREPSEGCN